MSDYILNWTCSKQYLSEIQQGWRTKHSVRKNLYFCVNLNQWPLVSVTLTVSWMGSPQSEFSYQFPLISQLDSPHNIYLLGRVKTNMCFHWDTWSQTESFQTAAPAAAQGSVTSSEEPVFPPWHWRTWVTTWHGESIWSADPERLNAFLLYHSFCYFHLKLVLLQVRLIWIETFLFAVNLIITLWRHFTEIERI